MSGGVTLPVCAKEPCSSAHLQLLEGLFEQPWWSSLHSGRHPQLFWSNAHKLLVTQVNAA